MNRNNFFLLSLFTLVLLSLPLVASAPVTNLDLTLVNPPSTLNKDLNFLGEWTGSGETGLYWQFDTDGNTNIFTGTTETPVFTDDFSGTLGDKWDISSGIWTIVSGQLRGETGGSDIKTDVGEVSIVDKTIFRLRTTFEFNGAGTFRFILGTNNEGDGNQYYAGINSNGTVALFRRTNGSGTQLDSDSTTIGDSGEVHSLEIIRDSDNLIELKIDDSVILSATDSSHDDFSFIILRIDTVGTNIEFDDVNVVVDIVTTTISSPDSRQNTFTTTGQKTVTLTVENVDGNTTATLDFNVFGVLDITVFDENKSFAIEGASIDFNSGTYITDSLGQVSIPLEGITAAELTITIDVNSDYTVREFVYDINQFSALDLNLLMLQTLDGSSRSYKLFQPDKATVMTNSRVEWQRTDVIPNGVSQRTSTSSTGTTTFFGQQDANYTLSIEDSVASVTRTYNGTIVTVKKPLDIENITDEIIPYNLVVGGLATQSFDSLSADQTFKIFSDTVNFYIFGIDVNSEWFPTTKLIKTLGGAATEEFQPYLVANDSVNLEATIFTINNPKGRVTVGGIRIDSFTNISGVSTLVESKFSDGTGQAIFHFEKGREYTLNFYDSSGTLIMSQTIEANNTDYFAYLELGTLDLDPITFLTVAVDWNPTLGNVIPDADGNVSFWQLLRPQNGTIADVNVFISHISDSNIIYNQVFAVNSAVDFNLSFDLNVAGFNDSFPLKVNLQIFDVNSVQVGAIRTTSYSFKDTGFKQATERAKDALGQFGVTLVSLILTVIVVGFVTSKAIGEDMNLSAVIIGFFVTLLFTLIGWISAEAFATGLFFAVGVTIWRLKT